MKKTILPLLLAICLCLGFLSGCTSEKLEGGTFSQPQSSQAENHPAGLTQDDLCEAETQLPQVLALLTQSISLHEPIEDASQIPVSDISSFIDSTLLLRNEADGLFGKNGRFLWENRMREVPIQDGSSESNGTYTSSYHFLPMTSVRRIAHEVFGVDGFIPTIYDAEWDGIAIPDGIGLNDFNSPGEIEMKTEAGGAITTTFDLLPGGIGDSMETSGRFTFHFQAMKEDGNVFVRFLRSEKLEDGKVMHVFHSDDQPDNDYEQVVADWFNVIFTGAFERETKLVAPSADIGDELDTAQRKRAYDEGIRIEAIHILTLSTAEPEKCKNERDSEGEPNYYYYPNLESIVKELELSDFRVVNAWFEQLNSPKLNHQGPQNPDGVYRRNFLVGSRRKDSQVRIYVFGPMNQLPQN